MRREWLNLLQSKKGLDSMNRIGEIRMMLMTRPIMGQRIRQSRTRAKMTRTELAEVLGVSYQAISKWERDIDLPIHANVQALAEILGVNLTWLSTGRGDPYGPEVVPEKAGRRFRVKVVTADTVMDWLKMDAVSESAEIVVTNNEVSAKAFALRNLGEAMVPEYKPGDLMIFDPAEMRESGDIVAANVNGAIMIRQYHDVGGGNFMLTSINPHWPAFRSDLEANIDILGTLVEIRRFPKKNRNF